MFTWVRLFGFALQHTQMQNCFYLTLEGFPFMNYIKRHTWVEVRPDKIAPKGFFFITFWWFAVACLMGWWASGGRGSITHGKTIQALKAGLIICERFCFVRPKMFLTHEIHSMPSQEDWGAINLFVLADVIGLFRSSIVCASQLSHDAIFKQHRLRNAELGRGKRGPGCPWDAHLDSFMTSWVTHQNALGGILASSREGSPSIQTVSVWLAFSCCCNALCICGLLLFELLLFFGSNID